MGCNFTANGRVLEGADNGEQHPAQEDSEPPCDAGGGLSVVGSKKSYDNKLQVAIQDSRFVSNVALQGGGLYLNQWGKAWGSVAVGNCFFDGNIGTFEGGGVFMEENYGSSMSVINSIFKSNYGEFGGAMSLYDSDIRVDNCSFADNWGNGLGGGVAVASLDLELGNVIFDANMASHGGAVSAVSSEVVRLRNVSFTQNRADQGNGGGLYLESVRNILIDGAVFKDHQAFFGGAAWLHSVVLARLTGLTITNNTAASAGGGIHFDMCASASITDSKLDNNTASTAAGGAVAAYCSMQHCQVNVTDSSLTGNMAHKDGGAAFVQQLATLRFFNVTVGHNAAIAGGGGGVMVKAAVTAAFEHCHFVNNTAQKMNGGAVLLDSWLGRINCTCLGCHFINNSAAEDGVDGQDTYFTKLLIEAQLPSSWQAFYDIDGGAALGLSCSGSGTGGGVCISGAGTINVVATSLQDNKGAMEGLTLQQPPSITSSGPLRGRTAQQGDDQTAQRHVTREERQQQQQQVPQQGDERRLGRKLLTVHSSIANVLNAFGKDNTGNKVFAARHVGDVSLPPVCAPLDPFIFSPHLVAVDSGLPFALPVDVLVRPCLPGQWAEALNTPNSSLASIRCSTCTAPLFSFTAYRPDEYRSGWYQPHPRSAAVHRCPHPAACIREARALLDLQDLQCAYRRFLNPADVDSNAYTLLQCRQGYAGGWQEMQLQQQLLASGVRTPAGPALPQSLATFDASSAISDEDVKYSHEEYAALLLVAVRHLGCLAQVVLDTAQVAAVILSQDLLWLLPDWTAAGLSGVVITQATTWQWMPFDCLLPGWAAVSGAVLQMMLVMLLPSLYVEPFSTTAALAVAVVYVVVLVPVLRRQQSNWALAAAVLVASLAYAYCFYATAVVSAFKCLPLAGHPSVPGEIHLRGSFWIPDMQLRCWQGLDVWNMACCWWWPLLRELVKFVIALTAAATTMRGPSMQAMLVLLLVMLASGVSWQSMALLVMPLTMQGVNSIVLGWVFLGLALVVVVPVLCILFWLAYRCLSAAKQMALTRHGSIAAGLA
eukprot:gene7554-7763_t